MSRVPRVREWDSGTPKQQVLKGNQKRQGASREAKPNKTRRYSQKSGPKPMGHKSLPKVIDNQKSTVYYQSSLAVGGSGSGEG